jgi:hypothetical protein
MPLGEGQFVGLELIAALGRTPTRLGATMPDYAQDGICSAIDIVAHADIADDIVQGKCRVFGY